MISLENKKVLITKKHVLQYLCSFLNQNDLINYMININKLFRYSALEYISENSFKIH